ncbi:MAG TPA: hypothetical protein VIO61_10565 [Anaerolineaceae bacterium]
MIIVSNHKLINRNKKIGQWGAIGSLVIFVAGFILSFKQEYFDFSLLALLVGVLISQVSIYFGNRWGRSPRPDERISAALKGLNDNYALYHYSSPIPHLLIGPAGIWNIMPFYQSGHISYTNGKWKQSRVNIFLKFFAQESLGRPDLDAKAIETDLLKAFKKTAPELSIPPIRTIYLFTNPKAELQIDDPDIPAFGVDKLKDFIRRQARENPVDMNLIYPIAEMLPGAEQ